VTTVDILGLGFFILAMIGISLWALFA